MWIFMYGCVPLSRLNGLHFESQKMLYDVYFGEGNGNPLQYSYLENPMERGAWQAMVHGVAESQTQLE